MTYGYCVYHERECDYKGNCVDCPYNTVEDTEWFRQQDEEQEKMAEMEIKANEIKYEEKEEWEENNGEKYY